jgi:uncharacterized protein
MVDGGMGYDLFLDGLHPVLPWFAFLVFGMWVGRVQLADPSIRRRLLGLSLLAVVAAETLALIAHDALELVPAAALATGAWPSGPMFVVAGASTALLTICLCIEATQTQPRARWVVALVATGQLAFTLYIAHAVAILVPLQHGIFLDAPLWVAIAYSLAFFAFAVACSLWWRRRYEQGPLEGLIRQITGRSTPAPWGGELAGKP